jgi:hypothetical protein
MPRGKTHAVQQVRTICVVNLQPIIAIFSLAVAGVCSAAARARGVKQSETA